MKSIEAELCRLGEQSVGKSDQPKVFFPLFIFCKFIPLLSTVSYSVAVSHDLFEEQGLLQ